MEKLPDLDPENFRLLEIEFGAKKSGKFLLGQLIDPSKVTEECLIIAS